MIPHLDALTEAQDVQYKGKNIFVDKTKKAAQILEVFPEGNGYMLKPMPNPDIVELFSNGVCLYSGASGLEIRMMSKMTYQIQFYWRT